MLRGIVDHAKPIGNGNGSGERGQLQMLPPPVVAGQYPDRLFKGAQPTAPAFDLRLQRLPLQSPGIVYRTVEPAFVQRLCEAMLPGYRLGLTAETAEGEVAESAR